MDTPSPDPQGLRAPHGLPGPPPRTHGGFQALSDGSWDKWTYAPWAWTAEPGGGFLPRVGETTVGGAKSAWERSFPADGAVPERHRGPVGGEGPREVAVGRSGVAPGPVSLYRHQGASSRSASGPVEGNLCTWRRSSHRAGRHRAPRFPHRCHEPTGAGRGAPDTACGGSPHRCHPWLAPPALSPEPPCLSGPRARVKAWPAVPSLTVSPERRGASKLQNLFIECQGEAQGAAGRAPRMGRYGDQEGLGSRRLRVTWPPVPAHPA